MKNDAAVVLLQESSVIQPREWLEAAQGLGLLRRARLNASGHLVRTERQRSQLAEEFRSRPPRLIFLSVGRDQVDAALLLLDELKSLPPTTTVAIGGSYGTFCSHRFTAHLLPGAVILGEWVEALVELAHTLKGDLPGTNIGGVWWKAVDGWHLTSRRLYAPDLANWPESAHEDFRAEEYIALRGGSMPILASRGYPFQTLFNPELLLRHLQVSESFYWVRPPERVIEEAVHLKEKFKVTFFDFEDDLFPWDQSWTRRFTTLWMRHVSLPFSVRTVAEHVSKERIEMLRRARLERVEFCVDGGNELLRQRLSDHNLRNIAIREAVALCHGTGVQSHLRILLGVPGETKGTLEDAVALAGQSEVTYISGEIYRPWPLSSQFTDIEMTLTGGSAPHPPDATQSSPVRAIAAAAQELRNLNSLNQAARCERNMDAALDGLPDVGQAKVRAPTEGALKVEIFRSPAAIEEVIALRVPAEVSWLIKLPKNPLLEFGLLIKPALPGERSRQPISFSVKLRQRDKTFRLFQKILVQALDPDSRTWHWFKIPITHLKPGRAEIVLECLVYGHDGAFIPPGEEIWGGWARVRVLPRDRAKRNEETTDHEFATGDHISLGIDLEPE